MKKKEPYVEKQGILKNGTDYHVCHMSFGSKMFWILAGMAIGALVGYLFYESWIIAAITAFIGAFVLLPIRKKLIVEKRKKKLELQFRDMLESLSTSIGAGSNAPDAFVTAESDMERQYPDDADIVRELKIINAGIHSNMNIETMLQDFADRSELDDIKSFADVFETCYRKGGDIKVVIKNTHQIISDKLDIKQEMQTVVAANKAEQNAMLVMPIVFVLAIRGFGSEMIDLSSPVGRLSTTIALIMFTVAYIIGKKILDIRV